jgi:hypothetical protein
MSRSGIVTKVRLFYAVVMTYDFKYSRVLRKKGMKLNDNIIFGKKDIYKFRMFAIMAIMISIFLNSGIIYGFLNYDGTGKSDDKVYFYLDKNDSYQLQVKDQMKVEQSQKYEAGKYKKDSKYLDLKISKVIEEVALNEQKEKIIAITFVQSDEKNTKQLKVINEELNSMKNWVEKNFNKKTKLVITKGSYSDMKYAVSKGLPAGKYIIFKHNMYANKSLEESDLFKVVISDLFDFGDEDKFIFADDIFHTEDSSDDKYTVEPSGKESPTLTPTATGSPSIETPTQKSTNSEGSTKTNPNAIATPILTNTSTPTVVPTAAPTTAVEENLALNKKVSASGYIFGYEPKNAVDFDLLTSWAISPIGDDWIRVDLGSEKQINSIQIKWSNENYPKTLSLYKMNGNDLVNIATYSGNPGVQNLSFDSFTSRYVHLRLGQTNKIYLVMYDLKIFGR